MENVVYHGSSVGSLETITPHKSTHGTYVYASYDKEVATIFAKKCGNDLTYGIGRTNKSEPWTLIERVPGAFEVMFNNPFSLYTLSDESFKDINTHFDEVVSTKEVKVLKEEKYSNVYEALKSLERQGKVKFISFNPNSEIIHKDIDNMLERYVKGCLQRSNTLKKRDFEELLFLHPMLLDRVNQYLLEENVNSEIFHKEDLVTILQRKLCFKRVGLKEEAFLRLGINEILRAYPELKDYIEQSLEIKNLNKEQLIKILLDFIFLDYPDIPKEIKMGIYNYYLQDKRDLKIIAREIYDYFKKFSELEDLISKDIEPNIINNSIILIGPMGVGKSSVAKELSELTNMPKISLDNRTQLKDLYANRDKFLSKKEFELYLVGSVFNSLKEPAIIDFGAGHSIYKTPLMFYEFQRLMKKFKNVVYLVPSEDKTEALEIINERVQQRGKNNSVDYEKINKEHLESPCNNLVATMKVCTKGLSVDEVTKKVLVNVKEKNENIKL